MSDREIHTGVLRSDLRKIAASAAIFFPRTKVVLCRFGL
ncbi:hypothetical protein TERTU_1372 [Teredinibacter turnerae T7901]|uniref:Uncharacterized protein n=1 Tax=Teredinibacter turnerae (strain ATCC 39867 / T7901) TaxID=377629 RepID=C5BSI1_TERTT|nr:hypothetical protein TERTU_1372 [Teredinibacter turnerae T7901]